MSSNVSGLLVTFFKLTDPVNIIVTGTNSITRWDLGGNVCKGGLISLAQYPPCAGRGVPSIEWCGSLVAFNEADPQGAGYCQMSTLIVTGDHTLVQEWKLKLCAGT